MDNDTVFPSFVVTHEAIDKIVDLGGAVRVWLDGRGCCELSYEFADSKGVEGDAAFGCPGAELFVSQPALEVLTGATLDYTDRHTPRRFRVLRNPNTAQRCPCNRSFGGEWPGREPDCSSRRPMRWDQ